MFKIIEKVFLTPPCYMYTDPRVLLDTAKSKMSYVISYMVAFKEKIRFFKCRVC